MMVRKIFNLLKVTGLSLLIFFSGQAKVNSATLSLAQTPLFLGTSIQPNVFFMLDDSGSMDWEFLVPSSYWSYYAYDPDPQRQNNYFSNAITSPVTDGFMEAYYDDGPGSRYFFIQLYAYNNAGNIYSFNWGDCAGDYSTEACSGVSAYTVDWRLRSNGFNKMWYSPKNEYTAWSGPCLNNGGDCVDADFRNVRSNPREGETGYNDLRDLATNGSGNGSAFVYDVWIDDARYSGNHPDRGNNQDYTAGSNGEVDLWDSHIRFTVGAGSIVVERVTYAPDNATGLNETVNALGTLANSSLCYNILGPITNTANIPSTGDTNGPGCRTIAEAQTNIANWYQYNRKRILAAKSAISTVISAQPRFRYGLSLFNEVNKLFIEVPPTSVTNTTSHNFNLKNDLYLHNQGGFGTPLRNGLELSGRYYSNNLSGKANPIQYSCQKNFTILLTDGYYNNQFFNYANTDGDPYSRTAADVAYDFYINDLNTGIADNVKVDPGEEDIDQGNGLTFQHMVTFTVAFGVEGRYLSDIDEDGLPDTDANGNAWTGPNGTPTKNGDWGQPVINEPSTIDDIWHAAFNSNGLYKSASSAAAVANALIKAIVDIAGRIGSASAVALNSGTLNANSRVYQAKFDSNDWSGSLVSIPIQSGQATASTTCTTEALGELCPLEWNAAEKLEAMSYSSRKVYTFNMDTNTAVKFKNLGDLGAAQQAALSTNPETGVLESSSRGQDRLDYVLGDNSNEGTSSSDFRVRKITALGTGKLGDIIHSSPAFSGPPDSFYPDLLEGVGNSYNAFRIAQKNRTPVVYVGANDGMLHAFNGADGAEKFAFIPGALVEKLNRLSDRNYNSSHAYYVDGSPKVFDAFNGSEWRTMLASSVGAGGQVVFGLDITNPDSFSASNVKWEFSDSNDADLGYTIGDVTFARMNNNQWVVIFGNGYNNTEADGHVSSTGNAVIYVVDAFTGALIKKFDTGIGTADDPLNPGSNRPNGMARVTPVDIDGDFNVDYLYAGDLFGNVWKVDVSATSPAAWDFAYKSGGAPKPFFIARDANGDVQAITAGVAVKRHPEKKSQTIVLFGTGKYFEVGDSSIPAGGGQIHSFYGIWDDGTAAQYLRSDLLQQEILSETTVTGSDGVVRDFRVTSSSEQPAYKIDWAVHKGWYLDLRYGSVYGERVVIEPVVRSNRVIFVTLIPDDNPCSSGGDGWIMELNADSGSRLPTSPFDVNGDGIINSDDFVNYSSADTIVSGVKSRSGIVAKPGILNNPKGGTDEYKYFSGTSGKVDIVGESTDQNSRKRQSWRQLR